MADNSVGMMAENVTRPIEGDVRSFIEQVEHIRRREDALTLLPLFEEWTGMPAQLWAQGLAGKPGSAIIGFGRYSYLYPSGHSGEFFLTGFSPRKANTAIYVMPGFAAFADELTRIGPHRHSVSCLYLTNLQNNDPGALEEIIVKSVEEMKIRYSWTVR